MIYDTGHSITQLSVDHELGVADLHETAKLRDKSTCQTVFQGLNETKSLHQSSELINRELYIQYHFLFLTPNHYFDLSATFIDKRKKIN